MEIKLIKEFLNIYRGGEISILGSIDLIHLSCVHFLESCVTRNHPV